MTRKRLPILLATMLFVLPTGAQAHRPFMIPKAAAPTAVTADSEATPPSFELTDADREAFQLAQQSSDPGLGEQRGGIVGLLILILLIVIIVILVD